MAIVVESPRPNLLDEIYKEIDGGRILTWIRDEDGDFTHAPEQWRHKAWLKPSFGGSKLFFRIIPPANSVITRAVYAVYHGRFGEMLLTHFDLKFSCLSLTALPTHGDIIKGSAVED